MMAQFYGAPPMAMLTVAGGTLLLGDNFISQELVHKITWTLWFIGTMTGLGSAIIIPYRLFTKFTVRQDSAFGGWNTIWLDARFRDWSIESELAAIACPLLAVQGLDDPYGTLEQIHGIARRVPQTELLELGNCGHSPHRDQADRLIARASAFIQQQTGDKP